MIKLIGGLTIVIAFGYIGMIVGKNFRRRPEELRILQGALQLLETEIVYGATPLPEAFESIGKQFDNEIGQIFTQTKKVLAEGTGVSLQVAWSKALQRQFELTTLAKSDLAILESLGASLGNSDRDDQKKHLHLAMDKLRVEEQNALQESLRYANTFNYLGFLCGLTLVIIIF